MYSHIRPGMTASKLEKIAAPMASSERRGPTETDANISEQSASDSGSTVRNEANTAVNPAQANKVRAWVAAVFASWNTKLPVIVHYSADSIADPELRGAVLEAGNVEAFYNPDDGAIHILADHVASAADAERLIRHEGMHWVFASAMRQEYLEILNHVAQLVPLEQAREIASRYKDQAPEVWLEEYLAREGQTNPQSTVWQQFTYETKRLLRSLFGDRIRFSDAEILAFLAKAGRKIEKGETISATTQGGRRAALSLLRQEKSSLLRKIAEADLKTATGQILRERLREVNALIGKMETQEKLQSIWNTPGKRFSKAGPPKGNPAGAALAILNEERNAILAKLSTAESQGRSTAAGEILRERLGELDEKIAKIAAPSPQSDNLQPPLETTTNDDYAQNLYAQSEPRPPLDPFTGGTSMVRGMVERATDQGRHPTRIPERPSLPTFGDLQRPRSDARPRRERPASPWQSLGGAFRRRDAEIHRRLESALGFLRRLNSNIDHYGTGQRIFDYLAGSKIPSDPGLAREIAELRQAIPTVDSARFKKLPQLQEGAEAKVYHDVAGGVVYKLFRVKEGKAGAFVPGTLRRGEEGQIRMSAGPRPSFAEFLSRMARSNAQELITPMEFVAVTPDGYAVFAQPFIAGRGVTDRNAPSALEQLGLHVITHKGGVGAIGKVNGKWVWFDDLHSGNIKVAPGGIVEVIDAINRELTPEEIHLLEAWGKIPKVPDREH
jgi:hypothetical protein